MIRKLTLKKWFHASLGILLLLALGGFALWREGPSAIEALQGKTPVRAKKESIDTIYVISVLGIIFVVAALALFIGELRSSIKKKVNRYLAGHSGITFSMLDSDFAAAEHVDSIWVGKRWSYCHMFDNVPLENDAIVWVHTATVRSRRATSYYICLCLADGKEERVSIPYKKLSEVKALYEKYPHILVGDNPEYSYMFKNDREALLDIKYRQAQSEYR